MTIKTLDELSEFEKLSLIPVSYSRFNTLSMCEAKYFFSYILKEPQTFGAAATLGKVSPVEVVKRNLIPFLLALLVMLVYNFL